MLTAMTIQRAAQLSLAAVATLAACGGDEGASSEGANGAATAGAMAARPTGAGRDVTSPAQTTSAMAAADKPDPAVMTPSTSPAAASDEPRAGAAGMAADVMSRGAAGSAMASATAPAAGEGAAGQAGGAPVAGASAGAGGTGDQDGRAPLTSLMYPIAQEKVSDAPVFHITRPMDLAQPGGLLPVIAWANGGCFRSDFPWQPLFDRWAGAGFVVLSLTGSGSDDDIASMLDATSDAEHIALIDWVAKANESGPYAGMLDVGRIALAGNSCGGVTALQATAKDDRVAAVFVLSGSSEVGSVNTEVMAAIKVPVGYVTGSPDEDVAAPNAADDYEALGDGIAAMLVQRTSGDHLTVSTDEQVLPEDAEIALNWLDLALYGTKQAHDTLTSPNVCEHCTPDVWTFKAKNLETLVK